MMFLKMTFLAVSLSTFSYGADQHLATDPKFSLEWRVFTYTLNKPEILPSADNIPVPLRRIPIHKDDGGDGVSSLTVFDNHVDPHNAHRVGTGFGFRITPIRRLALRAGALYSAPVNAGPRMDSSGNTREVNFEGTSQRGVGESLVYYSIGLRPSVFPSPYAEVEAKLSSGWYLSVGASYSRYGIWLERGWDRYNALEQWRSDKLGDVRIREPYLGLGYGDESYRIVLHAGPTFASSSLLPFAQGIKMNAQNGVSVGMSIYWDFLRFPRHRK